MLILNPQIVKFGSVVWDNVSAATVDRDGPRQVVEWSDMGPHVVFVDVPEQRVKVTVVRDVSATDIDAPKPGESDALTFYTSPTSSDGQRMKISMQAVVVRVQHEISQKKGAVRSIDLIAVSPDGSTDPVVVSQAQSSEI